MKHEDKAVAVKTDAQALAQQEIGSAALALASGPDEFGLHANDIRIATLLLMQPASGMVSDGKAKLGDIVNNENEKVIGGPKKPIEVIALYKYETIRMYQAGDGKFVKELPYEGKVDKEGTEVVGEVKVNVRRYHTINFFFLLIEDLNRGEPFPVLVRFKSSSWKAGNQFASTLYKKRFFNKLPYDQTGSFGVRDDNKNEKNQRWASFTFAEGRETTPEEKQVAKQMIALINAKRYTVLEAEDADESSVGSSNTSSNTSPSAAKPTVVDIDVTGGAPAGEY